MQKVLDIWNLVWKGIAAGEAAGGRLVLKHYPGSSG
jgi:hypothetical protein